MGNVSRVGLQDKTILGTGAEGFIGSDLSKRLLKAAKDVTVIGIDNMNDYYDAELKGGTTGRTGAYPSFGAPDKSIN